MNKKLIAAGLLSLAFHGVASAGAVAGATEPTQILNNIQLLLSYVEQAQQTVTQIQQYQTMLKNLQSLAPSSTVDQHAQKLWQDQNMTQTFQNLQRIVIDGQSVSYSLANLDTRFKQLHPGYGNFNGGYDYGKAYRGLSDNTLDSVRSSMALASAHSADFGTEQQLMRQLQTRSSTAQGQLQAVQAGNEIGMTMVGQLQKMRQLQMAQMNAQNAFLSGQQTRADSDDAAYRQIFNRGTTRVQTLKEISGGNR